MGKPHSVVVGSGIGGMTMALLLAAAGRRVTLLEISPILGGLMQRFQRRGVGFDTGFHFTGGMEDTLGQMVRVLGMENDIQATPFFNTIYLASSGNSYRYPHGGIDAVCAYLCEAFPKDAEKIKTYFAVEKEIILSTPLFDLLDCSDEKMGQLSEYDFVTLDDFLNNLGITGELRGILSSAATCHGTPPCYSPLTHHARVSYGLEKNICQIKNGGEAFIEAFKRRAIELGIEIKLGVTIAALGEVQGKMCHSINLTNGEHIFVDDIFFAIHPKSILEILKTQITNPFFIQKISNYEDTCGFFSVQAILDKTVKMDAHLTSFLSTEEINNILLPNRGEYATGMVVANETARNGEHVQTLNAFTTVFKSETTAWDTTVLRQREPSYQVYKSAKIESILQDVYRLYPQFQGHLQIVENSSMLTFRDYIPPSGCAYGVMNKMGEHHTWGRLPIRNSYALGQSSLCPGVLGTMMSSFVLFRQIMGEKKYEQFVRKNLT